MEDLHPQDKRGKIIVMGRGDGVTHGQFGTSQLPPRLISGRTCGLLFLTRR
ncbi:hypothetical protein [Streptomyces pratensis]|uniref:hypothetical protein n=1 Tax=Streptomyces pratensis TaxID=1169025 RepID=UPI0036352339